MIRQTARVLAVISTLAFTGGLAACSQGPGSNDPVAVDGEHPAVSAEALAVGVHSYRVQHDASAIVIEALDAKGGVVGTSTRSVSYDTAGAFHSSLRITQGTLALESHVTFRSFADHYELEGTRDGNAFSVTLPIGADGKLVESPELRARFASFVPEKRLTHWTQVTTNDGDVHPAMSAVCHVIAEAFVRAIDYGDYAIASFCNDRWAANGCGYGN